VQTLDDLHAWNVSVLAQTGLSFDLSTASGKLMRTIMAGLSEFERVKSGLASARARGVKLGRELGQRPSDKKAKKQSVDGVHTDSPRSRRGRAASGTRAQKERRSFGRGLTARRSD
jgi:DNA invertase Pin-like site-specific DNA recombinase